MVGFPDHLVPVLDGQLTGDHGVSVPVAVLEDVHQFAPLRGGELGKPDQRHNRRRPVVPDPQPALQGSTVITTKRVYRKWPEISNNDATLTSAVLDRLLHHAETVVIEGKSFRTKEANTDS